VFTITKPPPSAVAPVICGVALSLGFTSGAFGQVPSVLTGGPPVQVQPYVPEPGVPMLTITPGTANPFTGADGSGGGGPGSGSGDTSGVSGGNIGASDALNTLIGTPWGITAVSNAQVPPETFWQPLSSTQVAARADGLRPMATVGRLYV
jgi:hypothetical protein